MRDDVRSRFAQVAGNYSRSPFHTAPERMREVLELAQPKKGDLALDVASGTGNTAFALAPYVRRVIGLDLTREMLDEARVRAAAEALTHLASVIRARAAPPFQH